MVAEIILLSCAWEIYVFNHCLFSDWPQQELWGPLPCPHLNPPCPPTWFLVPRTTQVVKNLPVTQATRLQSLGREDPLEKEMAIHSSTLAWRIHGQRSLAGYSLWGCKELDTTEWLHFTNGFLKLINIFYYCDYVTIIHLIPLYHDWSTEKIIELYITKLGSNRKTCNHFLKSRCISELSWNFLKNTNAQVLLFSPELQMFLMSIHV